MNTNLDPSMNVSMGAMPGQMPVTTRGTKLLWGSVAVLGVAVLAMGATLVNLQSKNQTLTVQRTQANTQVPNELLAVAPPDAGQAPSGSVAGASASLAPGETLVKDKPMAPIVVIHNHLPPPAAAQPARPIYQAKRQAAPAQRTQVAQNLPSAPVVQAPQTAPAAAPPPSAPQVVAQAPRQRAQVVYSDDPPVAYSDYPSVDRSQRPVQRVRHRPYSSLGTVESVTPVYRNARTGGLGVVAGGVLGAIVGNQIGKGGGRTLGTIVGAVGGGIAGNAIERQMRKETVYRVGVRMDDGSWRTIERTNAPSIGSRINPNRANQTANTGSYYPSARSGSYSYGSERL